MLAGIKTAVERISRPGPAAKLKFSLEQKILLASSPCGRTAVATEVHRVETPNVERLQTKILRMVSGEKDRYPRWYKTGKQGARALFFGLSVIHTER